MIDQSQLSSLVKKYQTNATVILREYVQLIFLETLYTLRGSENFTFKGGTAVHLIYGAPRFSEDLDFTVSLSQDEAKLIIKKLFVKMAKAGDYIFKPKKTITGLRYMMEIHMPVVAFTIYMNLDFSFREFNLTHDKAIIETPFPVTTNSIIHHMGKDEIVSEKVRAILTRHKGRDIYDLWYLLSKEAQLNEDWIKQKFAYYGDKDLKLSDLVGRIKDFPVNDFIEDLRPFVSIAERDQLEGRYPIMQDYLISRIKAIK